MTTIETRPGQKQAEVSAAPSDGHRDGYPPIADHGLIGDLQTAALVTIDGAIDWFCCPRFDGPSVFAALLDRVRGGSFRIAPVDDNYVVRQLYLPQSAVLITRFMAESGVVELVDFMPIDDPTVASDNHRIVRILRGVRGEMPFSIRCSPRFDYARQPHSLQVTPHGAIFSSADLQLTLHGASGLVREGDDVCLPRVVHASEVFGVVLESGGHAAPRALGEAELVTLLERTIQYWRQWIDSSSYRGRWREMVDRSAITLKLLTHAPTGGLVAAPTAALPEELGGERNWDYRYTWIRDASFSVVALLGLGFHDEAEAFGRWLRERIEQHVGSTSGPLRIMYRVDGSSNLGETELTHLEGYRGSRPVRIGNGAADQLQLDIYGEALFAMYLAASRNNVIAHAGWQALAGVIDWLCDNWDQPEEGIWETRGGRREFVYGRLMCWVAFDRAVRLARETGRPAPLDRWMRARDAVYQQLMTRGWSPERLAFVQYNGAKVMDASVLTMPITGFVAPGDPQWLSTLDAIEHDLVSDSLVYRYDPSAAPDGLQGAEGTFSICSFWYVEALARSGRLERARYVFEKMLTYANHLGLYAEQIGPTGGQLGNFPQAFSHLALISAAITLDTELDKHANRKPLQLSGLI
jgi:GH15 family glucan-1,4-alpha-glucosidase